MTEPNSLEHYGVLGMKWGVRRTPEQLGHRREQKLEKYKEKETAKVKTRYEKNEATEKRLHEKTKAANAKREAKGKTTPEYLKRDQKVYNELVKARKKTYEKELKAIRTMSYKDMQKEKISVGMNFAGSLLASAGSLTVAALTPVPVGFIVTPNAANIKTDIRTKRVDERNKK